MIKLIERFRRAFEVLENFRVSISKWIAEWILMGVKKMSEEKVFFPQGKIPLAVSAAIIWRNYFDGKFNPKTGFQ